MLKCRLFEFQNVKNVGCLDFQNVKNVACLNFKNVINVDCLNFKKLHIATSVQSYLTKGRISTAQPPL